MISKNRILIIAEYFYPVKKNDAKLLTDLTEGLYKHNDKNIKVICTSELRDKKELGFIKDKIIRLKENRFSEKNLFFRIIKFIVLVFRLMTSSIINIDKNDRVLSTTNPAFLFPLLVILKKIKKFEYTLLVYDVFPENLVAAGIIKKNRFIYRVVIFFYNWAYSNVDRLIVIGRDMDEVVSKKIKNKVPTYLIENTCDCKSIIPENKKDNKIIQKLGLENKKVFLFSGNLGRVQGIKNLLIASTLVKNNDFILLFIGDGAMKEEILRHIENNDNNNVIYGGYFPPYEQNNFLNACDVAIMSLSKSMYGLGVPSKSYYNMAAGRPLLYIGEEKSEIARVINEEKIGWVVEPEEPNKLAIEIENICSNFNDIEALGKKSRDVVASKYSKEIMLNKYKVLFE